MRPLILTYGMGIGPEVSLRSLQELSGSVGPVVLAGRRSVLDKALAVVGEDTGLNIEHLSSIEARYFDDDEEPAEVAAIRWAALECASGHAAAMVTGPINKAQLIAQGFKFNGHTDFLSDLFNTPVVMGFVGGQFRVALVTTHIPLKDVAAQLSIERIVRTVKIVAQALRADLGFEPRFAVCGLNPHAGERGVLGSEEVEVIDPACELLRSAGIQVRGAVSAETAFQLANRDLVDMIIAMYHDQGLAPLKAVDFGRSVNWTMGLPILRTSVDHGTAEHLVSTGRASHQSMNSALMLARQIANRRELYSSSESQLSQI